jgi:hypothetical protein
VLICIPDQQNSDEIIIAFLPNCIGRSALIAINARGSNQ